MHSYHFFPTPAPKKEMILSLSNINDSFFSLPMIEAMMDAESDKSLILRMSERSKELFKNARDGQGFSVIDVVGKDEKMGWVKETDLRVAFNGLDGLPREDKNGKPYEKNDHVDSKIQIGFMGSGLIHKQSILKILQEKKLQSEKVSGECELTGLTLGLSIIKGAESHDPKDYTLKILLDQSADEAKALFESFYQLQGKELKAYEKNKKYFILVEVNETTYALFYVLNRKLVLPAGRRIEYAIKKNRIPKLVGDNPSQALLDLFLQTMHLDKPFIIKNKSASQNKASVFYDMDFESCTMFLDPHTYLLDKRRRLLPDQVEFGSFYDLQRSVPLFLMDPFFKFVKSNLEIKLSVDAAIKNRWSSWHHKTYDRVIQQFAQSSNEEKLHTIAYNIHLIFRLWEKTLASCSSAAELLEGIKLLEKEDQVKKITEWQENCWTFKDGIKYDQSRGGFFVDIPFFYKYLSSLKNRLSQLLISYGRIKKTIKESDLIKEGSIPKNKFAEIDRFVSHHASLIPPDKRTIEEIGTACDEIMYSKMSDKIIIGLGYSEIKSMVENPESITKDYLMRLNTNIAKLCQIKTRSEAMLEFNYLLRNARFVFSDAKETKNELRKLLQEKTISGRTALENAINNEWYDIAIMMLSYTQLNSALCGKAESILLEKIKIGKIKNADDFVVVFIKRTHELGVALNTELISEIQKNTSLVKAALCLTELNSKNTHTSHKRKR